MPVKSYNIVSTKLKYIYTLVWKLAKQFHELLPETRHKNQRFCKYNFKI